MINSVRSSKRSVLILAVGSIVVIITLFTFKDLNEKLSVMTASNSGYQKMTDSQADKIRTLQSELSDLKELHKKNTKEMKNSESELRAKLLKAEGEVSELSSVNQSLEKLRKEFDTLSKNHLRTTDDLNRAEADTASLRKSLKDLEKEKDKLSIELRDQIAKLSLDRDTCKRQYEALFKQHQESSDAVAILQREKSTLELRIQDLTRENEELPLQQQQQRSSSQLPVVQHPNGPSGFGVASSLSTKKEQQAQVNLEEPQNILNAKGQADVSSSTTQGVKLGQENVGIAQPPLAGDNPQPAPPNQPEFVQPVGREDVMEAPGIHDPPIARQQQLQQPQQPQQPLRQPKQRFQQQQPQALSQQIFKPRKEDLSYLQQQQQQLFHEHVLNQARNNQQQQQQQQLQQPIFRGAFNNKKKNAFGAGGQNLDQQVDLQDHRGFEGDFVRGHQLVDDYEGDDDAADGQLENHHYPVQKLNELPKANEVDFDGYNNNNIGGRKFPKPYQQQQLPKQQQPYFYGDSNNRPLRYLAQPPAQQFGDHPYRDF